MYNALGCRDIFKKFRPRRISLEIWLEIGRRNHPIETRLGIWRDTPIAGKREREGERDIGVGPLVGSLGLAIWQ